MKLFLSLFLLPHSLITIPACCQNQPHAQKLKRWQHLDPVYDTVYGISMDRAYSELLKARSKKATIVAVLDSGIDTLHADLRPVLWINTLEKGADEDANGYKNDRVGWNFLGTRPQSRALNPGFEYQRLYLWMRDKCSSYSDAEILKSADRSCTVWLSVKDKFRLDSAETVSSHLAYWQQIAVEDSLIKHLLRKDAYQYQDLAALGNLLLENKVQYMPTFLKVDKSRTNKKVFSNIAEAKLRLLERYSVNPTRQRLETIGDDYNNLQDRYYGDPYVGNNSMHGTHVAGIIAAVRDNSQGIDGIADSVMIMPIRMVSSGYDEYDKDVALAIRYAVDNGAKVINMSFSKSLSPQRIWVEEAIQYAEKKDVLIIHAAGNEATNIDSIPAFPTAQYVNGKSASNVITVGASGYDRKDIVANFSNYGKKSVDVFAPGLQIYSTVGTTETSAYSAISGTSMAAPVVAGLAAVLRSYFPQLTARETKFIIESSVLKVDGFVTAPGELKVTVPLAELCKTGGIVNAYQAIQLAEKMISKPSRFRRAVRSYFKATS